MYVKKYKPSVADIIIIVIPLSSQRLLYYQHCIANNSNGIFCLKLYIYLGSGRKSITRSLPIDTIFCSPHRNIENIANMSIRNINETFHMRADTYLLKT